MPQTSESVVVVYPPQRFPYVGNGRLRILEQYRRPNQRHVHALDHGTDQQRGKERRRGVRRARRFEDFPSPIAPVEYRGACPAHPPDGRSESLVGRGEGKVVRSEGRRHSGGRCSGVQCHPEAGLAEGGCTPEGIIDDCVERGGGEVLDGMVSGSGSASHGLCGRWVVCKTVRRDVATN